MKKNNSAAFASVLVALFLLVPASVYAGDYWGTQSPPNAANKTWDLEGRLISTGQWKSMCTILSTTATPCRTSDATAFEAATLQECSGLITRLGTDKAGAFRCVDTSSGNLYYRVDPNEGSSSIATCDPDLGPCQQNTSGGTQIGPNNSPSGSTSGPNNVPGQTPQQGPDNIPAEVRLINPLGTTGSNGLQQFLNSILDFVIRIGTVVVVLMMVFVGFKFVTAQGEPGEISKARDMLLGTVVGALILLGARVIAAGIEATVKALSIGS